MRPIDADVLECDTEWDDYEDGFISVSMEQVKSAETLEVQPLFSASWDKDGLGRIICSHCYCLAPYYAEYNGSFKQHKTIWCPNCAAKMKNAGTKDEETKAKTD